MATDAFGFEHHEHGSHREEIRHNVSDHSKVNERIELTIERRADRHEGHECLDRDDDRHAQNRSIILRDLGEPLREVAFVGRGLEDAGDRKLPGQERAGAGHDHQTHNDLANGAVEHGRENKAEGSGRLHKFSVVNDAGSDIGRKDVDHGDTDRGAKHSLRNILFRIVDGFGVCASRFQTEEGPQSH